MSRFFYFFIFIIFLFIGSCEEEDDINGKSNKIEIKDLIAENISYKTALVKARIPEAYGSQIEQYGHCWSTEPNPDLSDSISVFTNYSTNIFVSTLNSLTHKTTYYVRAYFKFGSVTRYGDEITFKTLEIKVPTLTTKAYSNLRARTIESGGNVTKTNGGEITARGVCWNKTGSPTVSDSVTIDSLGLGSYTSKLKNLDVNTTYYVRAYATNEVGTAYGNEMTFKTKNGIPSLNICTYLYINAKSSYFDIVIPDDGGLDIMQLGVCTNIEPNPTNNHIVTYNCVDTTFDSDGNIKYRYFINNLQIGKRYYARPYITNELGVHYGEEGIFDTQDGILNILTSNITNIDGTSANSGGTIINYEGLEITEKGVCWNTFGNPTITDQRTMDGFGNENYNSIITGLSLSTTYYVRAYTINEAGTSYGQEVELTTTDGKPILKTKTISEITSNSFKSGGEIIIDNGSFITEKGICLNKTGNPTIIDNKTVDGSGNSIYLSIVTNLDENETYFFRAYATNANGTGYGDELVVNLEYSTILFKDIDGNWYKTVIMGSQLWMQENLKTTHYPDGTEIEDGTGVNTSELTNPELYFNCNNNVADAAIYGRLYTWHTAIKACPDGWHNPTENDWNLLIDFANYNNAGCLKSSGTIQDGTGLWESPNTGGTDAFGFSILPSGIYNGSEYFGIGRFTFFYFSDDIYHGYCFSYDNNGISYFYEGSPGGKGMSIRCVKD